MNSFILIPCSLKLKKKKTFKINHNLGYWVAYFLLMKKYMYWSSQQNDES